MYINRVPSKKNPFLLQRLNLPRDVTCGSRTSPGKSSRPLKDKTGLLGLLGHHWGGQSGYKQASFLSIIDRATADIRIPLYDGRNFIGQLRTARTKLLLRYIERPRVRVASWSFVWEQNLASFDSGQLWSY